MRDLDSKVCPCLLLRRSLRVCSPPSSASFYSQELFPIFKLFILLCCFITFRWCRAAISRPRSLQLNHIQVVERHVVSIPSEDIHESLRIDACRVSISGGWLIANYQLGCLLGVFLLSLGQSLWFLGDVTAIFLKGLISVLDDETVHHWNWCRRGKTILGASGGIVLLSVAGRGMALFCWRASGTLGCSESFVSFGWAQGCTFV